jgi:hypothetical protein
MEHKLQLRARHFEGDGPTEAALTDLLAGSGSHDLAVAHANLPSTAAVAARISRAAPRSIAPRIGRN